MFVAEATCGDSRIPYSSPGQMKCIPVGLPPRLTFQQPALYKSSELSRIHSTLEDFSFLLLATELVNNELSVASEEQCQDTYVIVKMLTTGMT